MIFRVIVLVLVFAGLSGFSETAFAQQQRQQMLEEIYSAPEDLTGEWKIGEKVFQATDRTLVDRRIPIETGALAAILYVEQDGKNIALQIQPLPMKAADLGDGPYVFWNDESTAEVVTLFEGKVERKVYENIVEPLEIKDLAGAESTITLNPVKPVPPKSKWDAPEKLLAISDLEGNYAQARMFLSKNEVIDGDGNWKWGAGHLVLIGDLIDRGQQVTELMWMIKRLERQADEAGGQVHYVLGNHEAMVMSGDLRYIHPKYMFTSQRIGIPYDQLFSETSDIGRWWRSKNAVTTVGDLLFVHGGYSPKLDAAQLTMDTLNERIREGLAPAIPVGMSPDTNPVGDQHGPFWYRGYFDKHAATWGKASEADVKKILDRHQASHVVIGHTLVENVGPLDETGQVIGIDVEWANPTKGQGLLMADGKLWRLDMQGERTELKLEK